MPIEKNDCIGDQKKDSIVKKFDLLAIARFKIASGETIEGCCGELSDEQIIFRYQDRNNKRDEGEFSVGQNCAKQFLSRINQVMPELFDPYSSSAPSTQIITAPGNSGASSAFPTAWDPLNHELYKAILLWCSLNKQIPKFSTAKILADIAKDPAKRINEKQVFEFLKVLSSYKKSLKDLLNSASQIHQMKKISFPLLNRIASKNWIDLP